MDPGPDAGRLRHDAGDGRPGTLDRQVLHRNLDQLSQFAQIDDDIQDPFHLPTSSTLDATPVGVASRSLYDNRRASSSGSAQQASVPVSSSTTPHNSASMTDHHAPPSSLDPDDFYKKYQSPDGSSVPDVLPMTVASSFPSPVRANGAGSASRHPVVFANRGVARTNMRSVSSPVDRSRTSTSDIGPRMPSGKPSVKDLKRRFDQNAMAVTAVPAPHPSRIVSGPRLAKSGPGASDLVGPPTASTLGRVYGSTGHAAAGRGDALEQSALHQQGHAHFEADHQTLNSNGNRSFASRIGKPQSALDATSSPLNPTQGPSPEHPIQTSPQTPSFAGRAAQSQGLLFGEIPPDRHDAAAVMGYGIGTRRQRRTSDSTVQVTAAHQRNVHGSGAESPSAFYRGSPPSRPNGGPSVPTAHPRPRSRAHSEDSGSSPSTRAARNRPAGPSPPSSRLPVSVRTFSTPRNSTSPPSTRSTSPATLRRKQPNRRTSRTSPGVARARTPTQSRQSATSSDSDSRRPAHATAPSPKLPLASRSSRPRQLIVANSGFKMKESGRAGSEKSAESAPRRRKISIGPIDFAQRREHIRLAYTKTIRESEALEARHKVAVEEGRGLDNEVAASSSRPRRPSTTAITTKPTKMPISEGTGASAAAAGARASATGRGVNHARARRASGAGTADLGPHADQRSGKRKPEELTATPSLRVDTQSPSVARDQDSPTLGHRGSHFPVQLSPVSLDQAPNSAVSTASDTTEFDAEPQTNPPIQAQTSPNVVPITVVKQFSPSGHSSPRQSRVHHPEEGQQKSAPATQVSREEDSANPDAPVTEGVSVISHNSASESKRPAFDPLGIAAYLPQGTKMHLASAAYDDVAPSPLTNGATTIPFPRLDSRCDDSDCQSEVAQPDLERRDGDAATDACPEETTDDEQHGSQHRGLYDDRLNSYRTSTYASSEAGASDYMHYSKYGQHHQHLDGPSSSKLSVPEEQFDKEGSRRQSTWTDFSVDSTVQSDQHRSPAMQSLPESEAFGHVTIFSTPKEVRTSRRQEPRGSEVSRPLSNPHNSLHLPEVDTGDGFSVSYLTSVSSPEVNSRGRVPHMPSPPSHEPPPVPPSAPGSDLTSRTSSAFYDQSQYGSTLLNSERESDGSMSHAETSRSVDSLSITATKHDDTTSTPLSSHGKSLVSDGDHREELTEQERHRLVQRRNVLKELVDTEAVFVRDMNIVEEIYKGTAEACPKLDNKTIKLVFRNTEEIIAFHTSFLAELRDAVANVYVARGAKTQRQNSASSAATSAALLAPNDTRDRRTSIGPVFKNNLERMKLTHEGFLRASDQAAKRLIQIQQDPTVQVWLNECNEVAKDLTAAWDLDSLLIKPMQRITKYPTLIVTLLQHTPLDHPDRAALAEAKDTLETAIIDINKSKKNFELVGQIVGRKRKESDVKAGFARAFGKRVDKLQTSNNRPAEDADYAKLNEKFGDDYLRLQVVLRDVEFYTRQVAAYVHEFLQYMSSIELVMRFQPGSYPELESKWVQFNISVRDLEKVALEEHLAQVRKLVIEPFEHVIKAYGNPSLAMKKREKRRLDFERCEQLKRSGKSPDPKLKELVEQYEALNETLKKELPRLSALTERIGNVCLASFVHIQVRWFSIWKDKMKAVLNSSTDVPDLQEVVTTFERDFVFGKDQMATIGILNPTSWRRASLSMSVSVDDASLRTRARPSDVTTRSRGQSVNGDVAPMLPAPDFGGRRSGSFTLSPSHSAPGFANGSAPNPYQYYYRDFYAGIVPQQGAMASPRGSDPVGSSRSATGTGIASTRPSTGRSQESGLLRQNSDSAGRNRRSSSATYGSNYTPQDPQREQRFSNLFHSALPMSDGAEEGVTSQRHSRASSRERSQSSYGYNILWLAASLFEFNIATTKHEAGYPYLTYSAGEIFDVIAEKGELWLAKNQDDLTDQVGWIWSKHFAKLADS